MPRIQLTTLGSLYDVVPHLWSSFPPVIVSPRVQPQPVDEASVVNTIADSHD